MVVQTIDKTNQDVRYVPQEYLPLESLAPAEAEKGRREQSNRA